MISFTTATATIEYRESEQPAGDLRWDTPQSRQGQTVQWSFAEPGNPAGEQGEGSLYARKIDQSDGETTYFVRES